MIEQIVADAASRGIGPYSQAVRANGFIFVSGQLGIDPKSGSLVSGGIEAEAEQILHNVEHVLAASQSSWHRVVHATLYLADIADFAVVNQLYRQRLGPIPPARTTVAVSALPANARMELDVIALA